MSKTRYWATTKKNSKKARINKTKLKLYFFYYFYLNKKKRRQISVRLFISISAIMSLSELQFHRKKQNSCTRKSLQRNAPLNCIVRHPSSLTQHRTTNPNVTNSDFLMKWQLKNRLIVNMNVNKGWNSIFFCFFLHGYKSHLTSSLPHSPSLSLKSAHTLLSPLGSHFSKIIRNKKI